MRTRAVVNRSMAPELIDSAKCSTKVDVYSFGCVLYELIGEKQCYYDTKIRSRIEVPTGGLADA